MFVETRLAENKFNDLFIRYLFFMFINKFIDVGLSIYLFFFYKIYLKIFFPKNNKITK